jgi:hypothetical protein
MANAGLIKKSLPGFGGWTPDEFDQRDKDYRSPIPTPRWGTSVDLRAEFPTSWIEIYDRADTGIPTPQCRNESL